MSINTANSDVLVSAVGLAIQARRKELGISQEELASRSGLHRTYISEIERRSRNMSVRIMVRLAQALGLEPSELMRRAETIAKVRELDVSGDGSGDGPQEKIL